MPRRLFVLMTPAILAVASVMPTVGMVGWEHF